VRLTQPTVTHRHEADRPIPMLVWRFPEPVWAIASGPLGGGVGLRRWVINATVDSAYSRHDPDRHLAELARGLGLDGAGVGMLTAVDVTEADTADDDGATVAATVGLGHPTWAAAPDGHLRRGRPAAPGTINIVAWLPVPLSVGALVNAVATATEAKTQALWECGVEATGTASDALCILCPTAGDLGAAGSGAAEPYGGPRSVWGGRLARAVHATVTAGTRRWHESGLTDR